MVMNKLHLRFFFFLFFGVFFTVDHEGFFKICFCLVNGMGRLAELWCGH